MALPAIARHINIGIRKEYSLEIGFITHNIYILLTDHKQAHFTPARPNQGT